eukprot:jgi/Botrbrau1/1020/Bobra.114_1s0056.1
MPHIIIGIGRALRYRKYRSQTFGCPAFIEARPMAPGETHPCTIALHWKMGSDSLFCRDHTVC